MASIRNIKKDIDFLVEEVILNSYFVYPVILTTKKQK